ncbi:MAG: hypothetical protein EKK40_14325 [Bradyrhizobiaceae bacterium]|nr:MAG: hypothetical protein EKK40_14325 [Bradyrhizobiaceae bacterium]
MALVFCVLGGRSASAHVKWFCAYDVAGQPRGLENVLCPDFEMLVGIALVWLLAGCLIENTSLGDAMIRAMDRVTVGLRTNTETMIRAVCAFFFISLWAIGGIILTPELKTTSAIVGPLQLAIAAGLLSRRTMPLSALGIVILFGIAVRDYGAFHLADYPIFLGVAAYLALTGLQKKLFGIEPLDVVRYATAVTLMWASVEKWAYPEWSFPLFITHPGITLGFDGEFYMRAAGVVEFALAFSLAWTPLVRRYAAAVLAGMFIGACFEFGKIDTIGHSAIIAVLFAIIADNRRVENDQRVRIPLLAPAAFCVALVATMFVYYVAHAEIFNTTIL